jgi:recombination protein RecA
MAPPFKNAEFDIMYGEGISRTGEIIDLGVETGVIDKSGSWYSYNGERIGQGRENVKSFLYDNKDLMETLSDTIRSSVGLNKKQKTDTTKDSLEEGKA